MDGVHFYQIRDDSTHAGPNYQDFTCGFCGKEVHGRRVLITKQKGDIQRGYVICGCGEGTAVHIIRDNVVAQWPSSRPFHSSDQWPEAIQSLFDEAATALAAAAYTSTAMICRKALMVTSHSEGASDDKSFSYYVDYLADDVLTFPRARDAIDRIRNIGNAANHEPQFISEPEAKEAMEITKYLLDSLYAFPGAVSGGEDGDGGE